MAKKNDKITTGIFDKRGGKDTLSPRGFYGSIGLFTALSLAFTALMISLFPNYANDLNLIGVLGLFGVSILGVIVSVKSDYAPVSLLGLGMISGAFGLLLSNIGSIYSPTIIHNAMTLTFLITTVMGVSGFIFPKFYESIGGALFIALSGLVVVRILGLFIPFLREMILIDYFSAGLFSLYIGYDMYRASVITKTLDNAVDVAVELYLDIMNLFLTLLRIFGKK